MEIKDYCVKRVFFSTAFRLSCPILPEIGAVSPLQVVKIKTPTSILTNAKAELKIVQPIFCHDRSARINDRCSTNYSDDESKKRKSVSILLPSE